MTPLAPLPVGIAGRDYRWVEPDAILDGHWEYTAAGPNGEVIVGAHPPGYNPFKSTPLSPEIDLSGLIDPGFPSHKDGSPTVPQPFEPPPLPDGGDYHTNDIIVAPKDPRESIKVYRDGKIIAEFERDHEPETTDAPGAALEAFSTEAANFKGNAYLIVNKHLSFSAFTHLAAKHIGGSVIELFVSAAHVQNEMREGHTLGSALSAEAATFGAGIATSTL